MRLIELIKVLQDWRAQLENWGVTAETLIFAGAVALILFLLSAREVLGWYFKIHGLRDDVRDLRKQVVELQSLIQDLHEIKEKPESQPKDKVSAAAKAEGETPGPKPFRLDH